MGGHENADTQRSHFARAWVNALSATFGIWLISRVCVIGLTLLTRSIYDDTPLLTLEHIESLIVRWDGDWYRDVAAHGYRYKEADERANRPFFPLYPMLVKVFATLTQLPLVLAGSLLSNLALWFALAGIFQFCQLRGLDDARAKWVIALVAFAPQGVVFSAMYAESLFLALSAAAMLCMLRREYVLAAVLGALSAATRPSGFLLALFMVGVLLQQYHYRDLLRFWQIPKPFLPAVSVTLGLFSVLWLHYLDVGDAFAHSNATMHGWQWSAHWPWDLLRIYGFPFSKGTVWLSISLAFLLATGFLLNKSNWPEGIWCLGHLGIISISGSVESNLRYFILLFPIYVGLARHCNTESARSAFIACWACFGGLLIAAWVYGKALI
jgi:Mannosyltransferase (PIG-V)